MTRYGRRNDEEMQGRGAKDPSETVLIPFLKKNRVRGMLRIKNNDEKISPNPSFPKREA